MQFKKELNDLVNLPIKIGCHGNITCRTEKTKQICSHHAFEGIMNMKALAKRNPCKNSINIVQHMLEV